MARKQHTWATFINWINAVAISDDGKRVVAGTYFPRSTQPNRLYGTFVYNETGQLIFSDEYMGDRGIYSVAVSADGNFAASGGVRRENGGGGLTGLIRAYDLTTAPPTRILDFTGLPFRANSVAMSQDGSLLVAAAKKLYLFERGIGGFPAAPTIFNIDAGSESDSICADPNGQWFAASDQSGSVHLCQKDATGVFQQVTFVTPVRPQVRCVAASANGFLAAGCENGMVYIFDVNAFAAGPVAQIDLTNLPQRFDVRLVGISADATLVAASTNQKRPGIDTGRVFALTFNSAAQTLTRKWDRPTTFGANGVSVDRLGKFVAASDGQPFNGNTAMTPGTFYLFDQNGAPVWDFETSLMNWPIAVSGDGKAVATGGDDGTVHYFDTNP